MDLTFSLKNVAPGDYMDETGKNGAILVDNTFFCFCLQLFQETTPPVHVKKKDLASGASMVGLSPDWVYLVDPVKVENGRITFLDCDSTTFTYATFGDDTPQVGYAGTDNAISHDVTNLPPTPLGEASVFTVTPKIGKMRRLVVDAKGNTLFDQITFHNVVQSDTEFDKKLIGEMPDWIKATSK